MLQRKDYKMDSMTSTSTWAINLVFGLVIAALSIAGYILTTKRIGQHWPFWIVLALGWIVYAIPFMLLLSGYDISAAEMAGLYIASFLLIVVSIALMFLKIMDMMKKKEKQ